MSWVENLSRTTYATTYGTGVVVYATPTYCRILTCSHNFRGATRATRVKAEWPNGTIGYGKIIKCQPDPDLALLEIKTSGLQRHVNIAETEPKTFNMAGYPRAGPLRLLNGNIYAESAILSRETMKGDSGGGYFNQNSELCGIHWGGIGKRGYCVRLPVIRRWIGGLILKRRALLKNPEAKLPSVPVGDFDEKILQINARIDSLIVAIKAAKPQQGIQGPQGPRGPPGPPGPPGASASEGKLAAMQAEINELRSLITGLQGILRIRVTPK